MEPLWIEPATITRITGRVDRKATYRVLGTTRGGDWDLPTATNQGELPVIYGLTHLTEGLLFKAIRDRFERGAAWESTEFFSVTSELVASGRPVWHGCASREDLLRRCESVDRLYRTIERNGFRTQAELYPNRPRIVQAIDEIRVDRARTGELLFVNGIHRISIALVLGIERVPVTVMVTHASWSGAGGGRG